MSHYLDTSALLPLHLAEERSEAMTRWVSEGSRKLFVADFVVTEFNAVVSRLVRMGSLIEDHAATIRRQFEVWRDAAAEPLENLPTDIRAAGILVRNPQPKLMSADAIHLATSGRVGLTLVTYDTNLQFIASREGVRWEAPHL